MNRQCTNITVQTSLYEHHCTNIAVRTSRSTPECPREPGITGAMGWSRRPLRCSTRSPSVASEPIVPVASHDMRAEVGPFRRCGAESVVDMPGDVPEDIDTTAGEDDLQRGGCGVVSKSVDRRGSNCFECHCCCLHRLGSVVQLHLDRQTLQLLCLGSWSLLVVFLR